MSEQAAPLNDEVQVDAEIQPEVQSEAEGIENSISPPSSDLQELSDIQPVTEQMEEESSSMSLVIPSVELEKLSEDVYQRLFSKSAPEGISSEQELWQGVSKELSSPHYSFEANTKPQIQDLESERKVEDYIERAYYNSEAFAQRAARSLGYQNVDEMTPEHREQYEEILSRGRDAHIIERDDSISDSPIFDFINNSYTPGKQEEKNYYGISNVGHEMGHFLYNPEEGISPGDNSRNGYMAMLDGGLENHQYGKDDSPLNTINMHPSDYKKAKEVYKNLFSKEELKEAKENASKEEMSHLKEVFGTTDIKKIAILGEMIHDDAGIERGADVHGARMQMMKEGIWNFFDGTDVSKEQVEKYYENHPESRVKNYWDDDKTEYYFNNIAQNGESAPKGNEKTGQQPVKNEKMDFASLADSAVDMASRLYEQSESEQSRTMSLGRGRV